MKGDIIKETKYLIFQVLEEKPKTKKVGVINRNGKYILGIIEWYGPWRQYVFQSKEIIVWNKDCLQDVINVINQLKTK